MSKKHSVKHHYLPVFYLKGFVELDGLFFIYDKKTKKILKDKPENFFYEKHRNSINSSEGKIDSLEELYTSLVDTPFASTFKNLRENNGLLDEDIITNLLFFIAFQRWRVPMVDDSIQKVLINYDFEDLKYQILVDGKPIKGEMKESLKKSEAFIKSQSIIIPTLPFYNEEKMRNVIFNFKLYHQGGGMGLTGDNPLISKNPEMGINDLSNFIFPVSKNLTAVCIENNKISSLGIMFYFQKDLLILHQAERFVCCNNNVWLQKLITFYEDTLKNNQQVFLRKSLFNRFP